MHAKVRDQNGFTRRYVLKCRRSSNKVFYHYLYYIIVSGGPPTKTLRVAAKCKPLADKFVDIFGEWIKQQTGDVRQYSEMFRHVSYFRLVVLACL